VQELVLHYRYIILNSHYDTGNKAVIVLYINRQQSGIWITRSERAYCYDQIMISLEVRYDLIQNRLYIQAVRQG
jgi:hypothetical protein